MAAYIQIKCPADFGNDRIFYSRKQNLRKVFDLQKICCIQVFVCIFQTFLTAGNLLSDSQSLQDLNG